MKKHILLLLGVMVYIISGCSPQSGSSYSLGTIESITDQLVSFESKVSEGNKNIIEFENTSNYDAPHSLKWDLGNGTVVNGKSVKGVYPQADTYTVTLTISAADGSVGSLSKIIIIEQDDFSLIDTPTFNMLTGGGDNLDGKTWVLDKYNNFTDEVAAASGFQFKGHYGLGPQGSYAQEWWAAGPADKEGTSLEVIYDAEYTFIQNGTKLIIKNNGKGGGRKASASSVGNFDIIETDGDDALFNFDGGSFNFSLDESGEHPLMTLTGNAYLGYYCGEQLYEIVYLSEEAMGLRVNNTVEEQDWLFVLCLKELSIDKPKESKATPLHEDFESDKPSVKFVGQDMGDRHSLSYSNPAPFGINTSMKVCAYEKTSAFYSNLSFNAEDYKFDLTKVNKVKMDVYIPEYNDYDSDFDIAGEWISNTKLLPQVAVKLQNSDKGDNAWEDEVVILKEKVQKGKWITLEFDFSNVKDRKDLDAIVIQFGGEGHAGPGIFFFDNFSFDE